MPDVWPMAVIPKGGYKQGEVPDDVWELLATFDGNFTAMLNQLQNAWERGDQQALIQAVVTMRTGLKGPAVALMQKRIGAGQETYGPCFRLV